MAIQQYSQGKNILDYAIDPKLEVRIETGIEFFDNAFDSHLGKGLTPSGTLLLSGMSSCGKTTCMIQVMNALSQRDDCVCLFNSTEQKKEQVRSCVNRMGIETGFYFGQDRLIGDILLHAEMIREENPGKQLILCCDSLQTIDDGKYADGTINNATNLRVCQYLIEYCQSNYTIGIMIGQVTKDGDFAGKNRILHEVDQHMHLYFDLAKRSPTYGERIMELKKNRFGTVGAITIFGIDKKGLYEKGTYEHIDE